MLMPSPRARSGKISEISSHTIGPKLKAKQPTYSIKLASVIPTSAPSTCGCAKTRASVASATNIPAHPQ